MIMKEKLMKLEIVKKMINYLTNTIRAYNEGRVNRYGISL